MVRRGVLRDVLVALLGPSGSAHVDHMQLNLQVCVCARARARGRDGREERGELVHGGWLAHMLVRLCVYVCDCECVHACVCMHVHTSVECVFRAHICSGDVF